MKRRDFLTFAGTGLSTSIVKKALAGGDGPARLVLVHGRSTEIQAGNREARFALKSGLHQVSLSVPVRANRRRCAILYEGEDRH